MSRFGRFQISPATRPNIERALAKRRAAGSASDEIRRLRKKQWYDILWTTCGKRFCHTLPSDEAREYMEVTAAELTTEVNA